MELIYANPPSTYKCLLIIVLTKKVVKETLKKKLKTFRDYNLSLVRRRNLVSKSFSHFYFEQKCCCRNQASDQIKEMLLAPDATHSIGLSFNIDGKSIFELRYTYYLQLQSPFCSKSWLSSGKGALIETRNSFSN